MVARAFLFCLLHFTYCTLSTCALCTEASVTGSMCSSSGGGGYGQQQLLASSPLPGSTCLMQQQHQHQCTTLHAGQIDQGGYEAAVYRAMALTPIESPPQHSMPVQEPATAGKAARTLSSPPPAASAPSARSASSLTLLQPGIAAVSYSLPSIMAPYPTNTGE